MTAREYITSEAQFVVAGMLNEYMMAKSPLLVVEQLAQMIIEAAIPHLSGALADEQKTLIYQQGWVAGQQAQAMRSPDAYDVWRDALTIAADRVPVPAVGTTDFAVVEQEAYKYAESLWSCGLKPA